MFGKVLNKARGQYVWEPVFGRFNLFFHKSIHTYEMFIVFNNKDLLGMNGFVEKWMKLFKNQSPNIFIGNIATELKNSLNATFIKFDCSRSFDYMKMESYIFVLSGPLHIMMLGTVDK